MTGPATMLQLENITVDFDGFKAIDDLSLAIPSGSMTVVIGPNGAGKSTMCDTLLGRVRAAYDRKRDVQGRSVSVRVGLGGRRIYKKKKHDRQAWCQHRTI